MIMDGDAPPSLPHALFARFGVANATETARRTLYVTGSIAARGAGKASEIRVHPIWPGTTRHESYRPITAGEDATRHGIHNR